MPGRERVINPRDVAGLAEGESFVDLDLAEVDPTVAMAVQFARNIETMLAEMKAAGVVTSMSDFAVKSGVSHPTIGRLIRGERWVNGELLAKLEVASGYRLWGDRAVKYGDPVFVVGHDK